MPLSGFGLTALLETWHGRHVAKRKGGNLTRSQMTHTVCSIDFDFLAFDCFFCFRDMIGCVRLCVDCERWWREETYEKIKIKVD